MEIVSIHAVQYPLGWFISVQIKEGKTYYGSTIDPPKWADFQQVARVGSKADFGPAFAKMRSLIRTTCTKNARLEEVVKSLTHLPF